jgi:hypothetical protein
MENIDLCESRSCSVLTVCGAPVGREEASTRVLLLWELLSLYAYVCTANGQERVALLARR